MPSQRQIRNKAMFAGVKSIAFKNKKLFTLPLINTFINTTIIILFIQPWYEYETQRINTHNLPFYHLISFYVMLLLFHYIRNLVNAFFNNTTLIHIDNTFKHVPHPLKNAIQQCLKNAKTVFIWSSFISCLGGFYRIYSLAIEHRHQRKPFGGSYFNYAHIIAAAAIMQQSLSPFKLLKLSGELFHKTWGAPPLRQGFNLLAPLICLFLFCIIPAMLSLMLFTNNPAVIKGGFIFSGILLFFYISAEKLISNILHLTIYQYCTKQPTSDYFNKEHLKKAYVPYIIEE